MARPTARPASSGSAMSTPAAPGATISGSAIARLGAAIPAARVDIADRVKLVVRVELREVRTWTAVNGGGRRIGRIAAWPGPLMPQCAAVAA